MKIAIDATFTPNGGSLGHLQEFIRAMGAIYNKTDLLLYLKRENIEILDDDILENCTVKIVPFASYGNIVRVFWGQFFLPFIVIKDSIDVLFCPGNISPIIKTTKIKSQWIATIGPFCKDVYFGLNTLEKFIMKVNKWLILLSGYTSNVVVHESGYSRLLFETNYKYSSKKQYLIECGKDDFFLPNDLKIVSNNDIVNISSEDLLCVSHLYPYKNIELLIRVFSVFKKNNNSKLKLFIAGQQDFFQYFSSLQDLVKKHKLESEVIFTGMVSKKELRYAYSKCKLFIFPSLCESSGYTLIEAMSCGAPVLASNKTAIPYTCKEGAEYFDAYSDEDLSLKLETILHSNELLQNMKEKSLKRASEMIDYKKATHEFLTIINNKF